MTMNTQPIFDFLSELETRSLYVHPVTEAGDDESVKRAKNLNAFTEYLIKLKDMKSKLETCVAQMVLENPSMSSQMNNIADRLNRIIEQYRSRKQDAMLATCFPDDQRAALLMAEETMKSLEENYEINSKDKVVLTMTQQNEDISTNNDKEIITGIRSLANVLGVGLNKANAIVQSGILEKEHIQWNEGYWKFDKKKLLQFKKDNPNAFAKINCTR